MLGRQLAKGEAAFVKHKARAAWVRGTRFVRPGLGVSMPESQRQVYTIAFQGDQRVAGVNDDEPDAWLDPSNAFPGVPLGVG